MDGSSLAELLDQYAERIRRLPVPPLPDPEPGNRGSQIKFDITMRIRSFGLTAVDRTLPGASPAEIADHQRRIGHTLPSQVREWFEWSNGQAGGLWDDDDHVACVLPFGRQLDLATSEQLAAAMPAQHLTEVLQPCYVIQEYWTSLLVECAGPNAGSVWLNQSDAPPLELAYESLSDLVRQALRLLDLGWIYLNDTGTPTLRESTALEREGVVFEGDLERYHYWTIGRLPRSVGGP